MGSCPLVVPNINNDTFIRWAQRAQLRTIERALHYANLFRDNRLPLLAILCIEGFPET